ncbi:hypothetical protein BKA62DRAFT_689469 [Auriculariales sp. MPI-PUGE-AT-0066]|nr:hypothetical protein BKA62DRAFT_689469 [Auriculariales sp. MPI-PUGE-AT-0066]
MAPTGGYVSEDGHSFACVNPTVSIAAYHVIFLIDRSASMRNKDQRPIPNTPVYNSICAVANNRLGAVYSALFGFWTARAAAIQASGSNTPRRDSYSVALCNNTSQVVLENDFSRSPQELLRALLPHRPCGGNDFSQNMRAGLDLMEKHWRNDQ